MADSNEFPRFISNSPCGEDLFEGGAHNKLAKVIADTIHSDPNCTIIGIDGGWGSGKSNLVNLIGKKLNEFEQDKYHIFTYDAWGHQTDYPKRSILEELISSLVTGDNAILSNSNEWKQKLKNLLSKRREVSKQVVPNLSISAIMILIMIVSTSYLLIISNYFKESCLGWIIPSLFYIACSGIAYFSARKELKARTENHSYTWRQLLNYIFKIYQKETKSDTTYEQISEREPSSAQFKDWMNELNKSIANEGKTLIVVFDNMDRLPKTKVQELWAAIHSFFSEVKYSNIKTIVPFDREHIKGAFKSENIEIQPSENKANSAQNIISFGNDFINKTFYVVYPVAPPILTGWKSYFRAQWYAAMGKGYALDSTVLQIYDILTSNQTPRKIIAFINDFVTIKKVADPEIHDKYIALYIFGRESIRKDPLKQILAPDYLGALDFLYKDDTQMQECISSLHYQLPLENALDVVYVSKAVKGLDNNDTDFMAILKKSPKAIAILNHSITDVVNIKNAVIALDRVLIDLPKSQDIQNLWDALYLKAINSNDWISTFEDFHCAFVSHVTEKEKLFNYIVEHYHNNIGETFTIESYVNAIDTLNAPYSVPIELERQFNISPADFIKLISIKEDTYPCYGVWVDSDQLDAYLSELDVEKINEIECLRTLRKDFNLPVLREKFKSYASDNTSHKDVLENLFKRIFEVEDLPINSQEYLPDSKINELARSINSTSSDLYIFLYCMRVSRGTEFRPQTSNVCTFNNIAQATDNSAIVDEISKIIENFICYGELLTYLPKSSDNVLSLVVDKITKEGPRPSNLNIRDAILGFDSIVSHGIDATALFHRLNDWKEDITNIKVSDVERISTLFFSVANHVNNDIANYCFSLLEEYYTSISQEKWEEDLLNNSDLLQKFMVHPTYQANFFDALKKIIKEYAKRGEDEPIAPEQLASIIDICETTKCDISSLAQQIRDIFISNSSITTEQIKYFGDFLFKYGNLSDNNESLAKILPSEQIDSSIFDILIRNQQIVKAMMDHANKSTLDEFKNKLRSFIDVDLNDNDKFKNFCWQIGIRQSKKKEN